MTAAAQARDAILEAAMTWRQRMDAPDWDARADAELEVWLQADARHAEAFARTGALWDYFDQHAAAPEMLAARKALLGRMQAQVQRRAGLRFGVPTRRMAAALAGVAVLAALGAWPLATRGDVYATERGERRLVTLDDGSRISLDAETKLQVRFNKDARRLRLIRGQARFDVAKDVGRPFSVRAGDRTVVATGTAFNIDMLAPRVKVTLLEGHVLIVPVNKGAARTVELQPGQQLVAPRDAPPKVVAVADLAEATAWQRGKLVFDQEPLSDAVAKVNRYGSRRMSVDSSVAAVPVSGIFEAGDTNGFLEAITGFLPVSVVDDGNGVAIAPIEGRG